MSQRPRSSGLHGRSYRRTVDRKDLRTIFVEGVTFSVMVGIGESYLPAFVLALGMGEVTAGLIATLPLVAGGFLQLTAPLGVRWFRSYRHWAALCATVQATAFVPLIAAAMLGKIPTVVVFLIAALYWRGATTPGVVSGLATGSAVTLFFFFNPHLRPLDLHEGILGLLVHLPVLMVVSRLTSDPRPSATERFLQTARGD